MKIIVILPAALIGNFEDELRSPCGENNYITDEDRKKLQTQIQQLILCMRMNGKK